MALLLIVFFMVEGFAKIVFSLTIGRFRTGLNEVHALNARAKGWRTYEVACGHDVMLDMPERLAEILLDAGSRRP